jgi:hypothetical protein
VKSRLCCSWALRSGKPRKIYEGVNSFKVLIIFNTSFFLGFKWLCITSDDQLFSFLFFSYVLPTQFSIIYYYYYC